MPKRRTVHPSSVSARVRALLLTVAAVPVLVCCAATATAKRAKQPPPPTQVIELEVRELGGSQQTREFVVPINGRISGSITLFDEVGRCEARSRPMRDEAFELGLQCSNPKFSIDSKRVLTVDAPTIIGELEVEKGRRLRVLATRR